MKSLAVGTPEDMSAKEFVRLYGFRANVHDLHAVTGASEAQVTNWRRSIACLPRKKPLGFAELFALRHGRAPQEDEWRTPKRRRNGTYEWLPPELALLATLVGQLSAASIAQTLTNRLRTLTNDEKAVRTHMATQLQINRIGLQSTDVLGGMTVSEASKIVNSRALVQHAITEGDLRTRRQGRLWVIDRDSFEEWRSKRVMPGKGMVKLASIREALAIRSDKLSEFARGGFIEGAVRCTPIGGHGGSTKFGTWYIPAEQAKRLLEKRRLGLPMPWHGKPLQDNLRVTYKRWTSRKHPASCPSCRAIWGEDGAPTSYDQYVERYPPLSFGAKRHLTRVWTEGMSLEAVAQRGGCSLATVRRAAKLGVLATTKSGRKVTASKTDVARWVARGCPSGESAKSWLSLEFAERLYGFSVVQLRRMARSGVLQSKVCDAGPARGELYLLKAQVARLREKEGFERKEAARRLGVGLSELDDLLKGLDWRQVGRIPLEVVQAAAKRLKSTAGVTLEDAARTLSCSVSWIEEQIALGVVKVKRATRDGGLRVLHGPALQELKKRFQQQGQLRPSQPRGGLRMEQAASLAGVSPTTVCKWGNDGEVLRVADKSGWRYDLASLKRKARRHWKTQRLHRAIPPAWLKKELDSTAQSSSSVS